jgi:hypothetical protein
MKATGPALRGIAAKYEMAWLYKWVKNSSELIKSDPQAVKMKKTTRQCLLFLNCQMLILITSLRILQSPVEAVLLLWVALHFLDLLLIMALK